MAPVATKAAPHRRRSVFSGRRRVAPTLATQVERAKAVIRSERFFDGPTGLTAFTTLVDALEVASLPYYPAALHLQSYEAAVPVDSSRALLRGVRDADTNIFLDLFRDGIIADIEREQPDIVGISIPSMPQMLAAMTLAYLVKETGLPIHVTIGGPHVSMLREELAKVPAIWELIDSAVIFDGEQALLAAGTSAGRWRRSRQRAQPDLPATATRSA